MLNRILPTADHPTPLPDAAEPSTSTSELIRRAKAADGEALGQLFERITPRLRAILTRAGGMSGGDVDDALQETFLRIHTNLLSFRSDGSFAAWTARVAVNVSRDLWRQRCRSINAAGAGEDLPGVGAHNLPASLGYDPEHRAATAEELARTIDLIRELPEAQIDVINVVLAGDHREEAAAARGIMRKVLDLRLHRARRALAQAILKAAPTG